MKWIPVKGYEGLYEVSNTGLVKTLYKLIPSKNGSLAHRKERILKPIVGKIGYMVIGLTDADGVRKQRKLHRIIAEAFIENKHNKDCINHKNGIKTDNRIENLEWCTSKENSTHAAKNGLYSIITGEDNHSSKLRHIDVVEIRELYISHKMTRREIAKKFDVTVSNIDQICTYKTWNK
jgi:hypothetical protein